jgi:hypothetical protein
MGASSLRTSIPLGLGKNEKELGTEGIVGNQEAEGVTTVYWYTF